MSMNLDLGGKLALVTGGSRGIGACITEWLGRCGATVVATATSQAGAERIDQALAKAGIPGAGVVLDVTDRQGIKAQLAQVKERFGAVSVLVNNAGITRDGLSMAMKDESWDAVIDTNLSAVHRVIRALVRDMIRARHGRIINIGSVIGSLGNAGQANYAAAKAGLIGLTRSLARELAQRKVTVNVVAPGYIDTDMTRVLGENVRQEILQGVPAGSLGTPEDVAAAVCFLASDLAGYITGQTLHVNGGMYMG